MEPKHKGGRKALHHIRSHLRLPGQIHAFYEQKAAEISAIQGKPVTAVAAMIAVLRRISEVAA